MSTATPVIAPDDTSQTPPPPVELVSIPIPHPGNGAPPAGPDMAKMTVLRSVSDAGHEWDRTDPAAVADARVIFGQHIEAGRAVFVIDPPEEEGQVREFPENARDLVVTDPLQGG